MRPVRRLTAITDLVNDHDGFLVDLWGVVHDGERLGEGVRETLVELAARGARICFVTNTSRLGHQVVDHLVAMGVPRETFVDVVSSGDVTRAALLEPDATIFARSRSTARVHHIGNPSFVPWLFEIGLAFVEELVDVDLVIASGTVAGERELSALQDRLAPLAARGTPLVCTNPDRVLPSKAGLSLAPGAIAHAYASLGGPTFLFGKPHAPIYRAALARLGCPPDRVVAIGDMIETDIAGARAASLASVLVTSGVHASELGDAPGDEELHAVFASHGAAPDAVIARFGQRS